LTCAFKKYQIHVPYLLYLQRIYNVSYTMRNYFEVIFIN
jgi:hypothetical protein